MCELKMIEILGGGILLLVAIVLVPKFFPKETARFIEGLRAPSESQIKKQSDEKLGEMDRNLAVRKSRKNH
jgi:hypothetical protein